MKKLFLLCSFTMGLFVAQGLSAETAPANAAQNSYAAQGANDNLWDGGNDYASNNDGAGDNSGYSCAQAGCNQQPEDVCCGQPQEHPCGKSYCLYCKYEPCYYNTYHCVKEAHPTKKKCWRYVPKYTDKCCVKYVPQYYTQTTCKYVPECYYVDDCYYTTKKVCDRHVKWVPKYYYKCVETPTCAEAPACCEQ